MHIVILLAIALVLAFITKPKDKKNYHKAILAIFGITYFCIWRFTDFYFDIFFLSESTRNIVFFCMMAITIGIAFLPWTLRIEQITSIIFVTVFVVSVLLTFVFETKIKNIISVWSGYFEDSPPVLTENTTNEKTNKFEYNAGGFSVDIPVSWQKKKNELEMEYFVRQSGKKVLVEFRPSCFHNAEKTLATIVTDIININESKGLNSERKCFTRDKAYTCLVRSYGGGTDAEERWRWLVTDKQQRQNIEMDIVFYSNELSDRQTAKMIINSLETMPLPQPLPFCPRSADWF